MSKYQLRFWFEHGGACIWGMNDKAKEKFGYSVKNNSLPVSGDLINMLDALEMEYATYLDWNCPQNPSLWTKEQKISFIEKANVVYEKLKSELGYKFEVVNEVNLCVE